MLITKFNKLIRNKVVWGIFGAIVGISFAFGGIIRKWGRKPSHHQAQNVAGKLYGQNIDKKEFFSARYYELGLRGNANLTPEQNKILEQRTWKRIAALKTAEKLGLSISPREVAIAIQQEPSFQVNGVFNKDKYVMLIEKQLNVPVSKFEDYMREELLIKEIMKVMSAMTWIAPQELSKRLDDISDKFTIETATITTNQLTNSISISIDDAKAYFDENKELFRIPEKVSVKYIAIPVSNYIASVDITDDMISEYYEDHIDSFTEPSTNGLEDTTTPLADVRADIAATLTNQQAVFKAKDYATDIVMAMAPGRYTDGISLEEATSNKNLTVYTSPLFAQDEQAPGISAGPDFYKSVFELDTNDISSSFTDPIIGDGFIYVAALKEKVESRIPDFNEVKDKVIAAAKQEALAKAVAKRAEEIRGEIKDDIAKGKTFEEAIKKYHVKTISPAPFSVYSMTQNDSTIPQELIQAIMSLKDGEISQPVQTGVAESSIAYIKKREHSDIATTQLLRPQLLATISKYRARLVYSDWGDYLLKKADFKDYMNIEDEE